MQQLTPPENINFRQNDKKIKQKVTNQRILTIPRPNHAQGCESVSGNSGEGQKKMSIATTSSSKSKGKQGRLLLRDYLYITNKNSANRKTGEKSKDKKQIRKDKYKLDEQKIFLLMQDQMKVQMNEVIERLNKINDKFKDKSLKNDNKNSKQNISLIYSIRSIVKDTFKKGIEELNLILYEEHQRKFQMLNPNQQQESDGFKSDNCFTVKPLKKKQDKISLKIQKNLTDRQNAIPINGTRFLGDFF